MHQYVDLDYEELVEKGGELVEDITPRFAEWLRKLVERESRQKSIRDRRALQD